MPINKSYGKEVDKRTKELEKRPYKSGTNALQEQQLAQNQIQVIQNERRSNLTSEQTEAAADEQQNQLLTQAAELGVSDSTAATLGKYGMTTRPTVQRTTGREVKVTPNKINITNNTTNITNNQVQQPPQQDSRKVRDENTTKFKTWINRVNMQQEERAKKRKRDYDKREISLTKSANKMLKRIENVGSSVAEAFSPKTFGQTLGSQLKMYLLIFGMRFLSKHWEKVLAGFDWLGKTFKNFLSWVGYGTEGEAEAKRGRGLVPTIIRLFGGKPGEETIGDALTNSFKAALDHFALKLQHMLEERGQAMKKVKFNADLKLGGEGLLGGFLKNLGLENLFSSVTTYLGDILTALVDPKASITKKVSQNIQKKGMQGSANHMNKGQFESESWGVDKGDLSIIDKQNKHRYGLVAGAVDKQGNLTSKRGGQLSQSLDIVGALRDAKETGYVDPARFLSGLERMQKKAKNGFIAVDYEFLTTFLSPQSIKSLTQQGHIRLRKYKVVKVKKDNAYGSIGDYLTSAIGMGEATEGLMGQASDWAGKADKYASSVGLAAASKNMNGVFNAAAGVTKVASKAGNLLKAVGPYGQAIGLAIGVGTAAVKDLMENDNTLEFVPIDDPREAYKGKIVVLYEIDETVLKQIAKQFGTEKFDTSDEKLMTQVRNFMYQKAGGYGAVKNKWKGKGSNESINISQEYKDIHEYESMKKAHKMEEDNDEYSRRKAVAKAEAERIGQNVKSTATKGYKAVKDFVTKPAGEHGTVYSPETYIPSGGIGPRTTNVIETYQAPPTPKYGKISMFSGRGKLRSPLSTEYTFSAEIAVREAERLTKFIITEEEPSRWLSKSSTAKGKSSYLATYARLAIAKGLGMNDLPDKPRFPYEFADILYKYGFAPVTWDKFFPKKGDICVFGPTPTKYKGGYVSIYSGSKWLSDFEQNDIWPDAEFKSNRNATVFRHLKVISDKTYGDLLKDQYNVDSGYSSTGFIDFDGDGKWDAMKASDGSIYELKEDGSLGKVYTPEELNSLWTSNSIFSASSGESGAGYYSSGDSGPSHYDAMTVSGLGGQSPWAKAVIIVKSWWEKNVHVYSHDNRSGCVPLNGGYYRPDCSGFVGACLVLYGIPVYDPSKRNSSAPCSVEYYSNGTGLQKLLEQGGFQKAPWPKDNNDLAPFDILVKNGHVEIYAGHGTSYNWGSVHDLSKGGMPSKHPWHGTHIYRCVSTPNHVGQNALIKDSSDTVKLGSWDAPADMSSSGYGGGWGGSGGGQWTGQAAGGAATTGGRITGEQAKQNAVSVVNFLMKKGLTKEQALGVAGNIMGESGFNPSAIGDHGTSGGLAQWHGKRFTNLRNFAAAMGRDWRDPEAQMEFLWHELNTTERGTLNKLRGASSREEASRVWGHEFERFQGYQNYSTAEYSKRAAFANSVAETYGTYGEERGVNFVSSSGEISPAQEKINKAWEKGEEYVKSVYNDVTNAIKNKLPDKGPQFITLDKDFNKKVEAMSDNQLAAQIWLNNEKVRTQYDAYGFEGWKKNIFDKLSRKQKQRYLVEEEGKNLISITSTASDANGNKWSGINNFLGGTLTSDLYDSDTGELTAKGQAYIASVYAKLSPAERKRWTAGLILEKNWHDTINDVNNKYIYGDYFDEDKELLKSILSKSSIDNYKDIDLFRTNPTKAAEIFKYMQLGDVSRVRDNLKQVDEITNLQKYRYFNSSDEQKKLNEFYGKLFGETFENATVDDILGRTFAQKQYNSEQEKINNLLSSDTFKLFSSLGDEKFFNGSMSGPESSLNSKLYKSGKYYQDATRNSGGYVKIGKLAEDFSDYLDSMYQIAKSKYAQQHLTEGFEDILETDTGQEAYEKQRRNDKRAEINQQKYNLEYQKEHWQEDYNLRMKTDKNFRREMLWNYGIGTNANEAYHNSLKGQDEIKELDKQLEELNKQLGKINGSTTLQDSTSILNKFKQTKASAAEGAVVDPKEIERAEMYLKPAAKVFEETLDKLIAKGQQKAGRELNWKELELARRGAERKQNEHGLKVWNQVVDELKNKKITLQEARVILSQQGLGDVVSNEQLMNIAKTGQYEKNILQTVEEKDKDGNIVTKFRGPDGKYAQVEDYERDKDGNIVVDKKTGKPKMIKRDVNLSDAEKMEELYKQARKKEEAVGVGKNDVVRKFKGSELPGDAREDKELPLVRFDNGVQGYYDEESGQVLDENLGYWHDNLGEGKRHQYVSAATNIQDKAYKKAVGSEHGYSYWNQTFKDPNKVETKRIDLSKYEGQSKDEMMRGVAEELGMAVGEITDQMKAFIENQFDKDPKSKFDITTMSAGADGKLSIATDKEGNKFMIPNASLAKVGLSAMEARAVELGFQGQAAKDYAEAINREKAARAEIQRKLAEGSLSAEGMIGELLQQILGEVSALPSKINTNPGNGGTGNPPGNPPGSGVLTPAAYQQLASEGQ